jgi:3-hydroxyacyl-CoA dehydrogenase/enoyl-CoA hydratase/3-hydroxybutyryl-CoA epimerase
VGRAALFARAHEDLYARTRGLYPAPPMALNAIRIGVERGHRAGYAVEARSAGDLLASPATRNMIAVHFLSEAAKKSRGVADLAGEPRLVRDLGVIGAGVMGGGIAHAATRAEIPVRLRDVRHEAIARALSQVRELYHREVERGHMTPAEVERRLGLVATTLDLKGFRRADLVIEAVVEDQNLKMQVLRELEPEVREDCIIASNTSALSITSLAAALWRPSRCIGLHFFNPVDRMPLVEVVRGAQTEDWVVASAFDLAKRLGKTPLVVADRPGFLVNRILMPYLNEACLLLEEGFTIDVIDRAMRNFGLPLGPLELLDEIGLDVALGAADRLKRAYGTTFSPLLATLVAQGRLGRKSGLGFYRSTGSERRLDPEVHALVESLPAAGGAAAPGVVPELAANLQERLMLPMINEAARCLEEGVVSTPAAVDLGLVLGIGFPPFRGGILRHADALDVKTVVERMQVLAAEGRSRYEPAPLLVEMARAGQSFFPDA